jgi:hypothetical protein
MLERKRRYYSGVSFIKTYVTELADYTNTGQSTTMFLHVSISINLVFASALFLLSFACFLSFSLLVAAYSTS